MQNIVICGGHHNSALPLAKKFKENGYQVIFVGHKTTQKNNRELSSEYKEVTGYGFSFVNLIAPKFYRNKNPLKYFLLIFSLVNALAILIKYHPKLVLSYGGYLAVPVCLVAKVLQVKIATHEQTVTIGMANKLIAKVADKVFLSWSTTISLGEKYHFVGLPLREEILSILPRKKYGEFRTLFITGGKQASHIFNEFVFANIDNLVSQFRIIHQTAKNSQNNDYSLAQILMEKYGKNKYLAFDYCYGEDYSKVLQESDFLLSRSGAHITYEMAHLKIPAILVPIPWVSQNEQMLNAQTAKNYFPSVILEEKDLNWENFIDSATKLKEITHQDKHYKTVPTDAGEKMFEILSSNL
ncbi:glycosyltransferase [Candidatus Parcubacteria bacterium]|nr:glycosyltransferase [Patescibacteria group bacterium]MBU4380689.1 glycosyltransferase [Patescibacteria group bacterium]MCG2689606.1 glycosyltransferase [Candidatus Parcubacteria bacterium]